MNDDGERGNLTGEKRGGTVSELFLLVVVRLAVWRVKHLGSKTRASASLRSVDLDARLSVPAIHSFADRVVRVVCVLDVYRK